MNLYGSEDKFSYLSIENKLNQFRLNFCDHFITLIPCSVYGLERELYESHLYSVHHSNITEVPRETA